MKKLSLLLLIVLFSMTASAYTYYSNVEIGNFKYSQLALGSSSSEENIAYLKGLSSTASTSLTTLDIPGYVTYNGNRYRVKQINQQAFENNTKITTVNFGYGVEDIGGYVFNGCTSLKYVNLPSSVKEIGQFTFQNCTSLLVVAFAGEKAPKIYDYTFNLSSTSKRASTATYRGMNALKADSKWVAAFGTSNILRHYSYKVGDFKVYNSTNGCWQYYMIKNGVPYNGNSSNPSVRSMCMLVAATFTDGSDNTITLPQSVGNSDNNAPGSYRFYGVADSAFMNNTAITKITNSSTMAYKIGVRSFYGCSGLTNADVPVDTIGDYAFYNCSNLATVNYASSLCNLAYLGNFAFGKCGFTGTVNIPATTKYIGTAPFYYCQSLRNIEVDANNPNYSSDGVSGLIGGMLYNKAKTEVIQIPGNFVDQYHRPYFNTTVQRIRSYAAAGSNFKEIVFLYNLKQIDQYAFLDCKNLKRVHIPSSLTTVASNAFAGCDATNQVELNLMTPPATDYFPAVTNKSSVDLYMPYDSYPAYAASSIWSKYNHKTGTYDHTNCWDFAYSRSDLTTDYFTVTSTEPSLAPEGYWCDGTLKVVNLVGNVDRDIPSAIPYAGKYYVPTVIGRYAFKGYGALEITGAPTILTLEEFAFANSTLHGFHYAQSLNNIGPGAFYNCTDLTRVDGLSSVAHIGAYAFYNSGLLEFYVCRWTTNIGTYAFYNCHNLKELFISNQDSERTLTCEENFFGNNASDFKCYVDYRQLDDYINSPKWDGSKIYPHLLYNSIKGLMSFSCVKPISFEGTDLEVYTVAEYDQSDKTAHLIKIQNLAANNGAVVLGKEPLSNYYRLNYATSGSPSTSSWMVGTAGGAQTVNSNSTTSYFKINKDNLKFDKITSNTTFNRGEAYLKIPTNQTGGATTIYTNFYHSSYDEIPGDVNGDGHVSSVDVTALYNYLLDGDNSELVNGDQDGDGHISSVDITVVYNIMLGN